MNVNKMAAKDATRWAYAELFFGEGAGTRRKLLTAELDSKAFRIPGYLEAFNKAYDKQNFADLAIKAAKERKHLDRVTGLKRNVRGLVTGNRKSLTTGVAVGLTAWYIARETGLDEDIKREVKIRYKKAQARYRVWRESNEYFRENKS